MAKGGYSRISDKQISEKEYKKTVLVDNPNRIDIVLLKKYFNGTSVQALSEERSISPGQASANIKFSLQYLSNQNNQDVPESFLKDPFTYKDYWKRILLEYERRVISEKPESIESNFFSYFKTLTFPEKLRIVSTLQNEMS